jgi:hypothetical protein
MKIPHMFYTWKFRFGTPVGKRANHMIDFIFDSCNLLWLSAGGKDKDGLWRGYVNIGPFQIIWL